MQSVRECVEKWRKKTDDLDHMRALEVLALLLDDSASPLDAAKSIAAAYEASLKAPLPVPRKNTLYYNKVCEFWALYLSDAIKTFGGVSKRGLLYQLIIEMSRQPDVLDDNGYPAKGFDQDGVYWSDLPALGRMFGMHGLETPHVEDFLDSEREQYFSCILGHLNATMFAATLLHNGLCAAALSFEAACTLNIGLEHDYDDTSARHNVAGADKMNWFSFIPAAGIWLLIAGKPIYDHCMRGDTSKGWDKGRWNRESWALWKQQLGKFARRADFSDDCRHFAAETLKEMVRIEGGSTAID